MTDPRRAESPLRFALFGESIVADLDNPAAITARALMRALTREGHEAVFHEQRRNRAMVEQLRRSGGGFVRAFADAYPDLRYLSYDLPDGLERSLWLWRTLAAVDAVLLLPGAPAAVVDELARAETPHLARFVLAPSDDDRARELKAIALAPAAPDGGDAPALAARLIQETRRARSQPRRTAPPSR